MLSIGTITAGGGYQYLTKEVTSGAEDYYMRAGEAAGESQGWWLGTQCPTFGIDGTVVEEHQMAAFFGAKCDPATGEPLGSRFRIYPTVAARLAAAEAEHKEWVAHDLATRAAALEAVRAPEERWAESLAAHTAAGDERWEKTRRRIERVGERNSVAGYDLTFSAPKSVSVLWASAPDQAGERAVREAHHEGVRAAIAALERHGAYVRRGRNGIRQEKVSGVVAAAFDHRTSRTGDPQMHTHVAVLSMAKTADGRVLALDGRAIYGLSGALSAIYDYHRDKALARQLGVTFVVNERTGVREIAGVPATLNELWSSRRAQITPRVEQLKAQYLADHGRVPSPELVSKMAQWATLDTRPAKGGPESTEELFARWQNAARTLLHADLPAVWDTATGHPMAPNMASVPTEVEIVASVIGRLEAEKATWTEPTVVQVTWQTMDRDSSTTVEEDESRARRIVAAVLGHDEVLKLTPSLDLDLPEQLVRADGEAVYEVHLTARYATRSALNEEEYLVARCQSASITPIDSASVERALAAPDDTELSADQAAAVRGVLASRADVNVVIGPAGTGKTTTMAVLVAAWKAEGRPVLGLSISQTAANELSAATGAAAENIAKLLHETNRRDPDRFAEHAQRWTLQPGQLVIMDEAGMTDRAAMVAVTRLCEQARAKLVLVGDYEQLESPEAGGAMRLMANTAETFQLEQVHRFVHNWERDASLRLRAGDATVIDEYSARGRIYGGTVEDNDQRAVHLALADHLAGQRTFILAANNERAARVAGMFRAGLVHYGRVETDGVGLGDGNLAGIGDRIVCRQNNRHLTTTGGAFVTNRSVYQVLARHPDSSLTVAVVPPDDRRPDPTDTITLPPEYVATSVALEYAGTVHAAQGGTRFSSHALISERDDANSIYVAMTRGRSANIAHVDSEHDNGPDQAPTVVEPVAVLVRVLQNKNISDNLSAVEARDLAVEQSNSLATLLPVWSDLAGEHAKSRWHQSLVGSQGDQFAARVVASKAWPALSARLDSLAATGADPETALQTAIEARSLTGVTDVAAVLHHRLEHDADTATEQPLLAPFAVRISGNTPYAPALHQLAARIDSRIAGLGERAAQNPPDWAEALGPVPDDDTVGRAEWVDRAATIASYREAFNPDGPDPIGDPLSTRRSEARRWWNAAQQALDHTGQPSDWATDHDLSERIAAGDRAETARPQPPDLAEAARLHRAWQAEHDHAHESVYLLRRNPATDPDDLAQAEHRLRTARQSEEASRQLLRLAEADHDAYRQWETNTAATRAEAETARQELARRTPATPKLSGQPTSWVAHRAAEAQQHLERKQRALQSAERAITRITARLAGQPTGSEEDARQWQPVLERHQADAARLTLEVDAAASAADQLRGGLAERPDGDQAKTAVFSSQSDQPRGQMPVRHQPPEYPSQRPTRPTI